MRPVFQPWRGVIPLSPSTVGTKPRSMGICYDGVIQGVQHDQANPTSKLRQRILADLVGIVFAPLQDQGATSHLRSCTLIKLPPCGARCTPSTLSNLCHPLARHDH
jgi:hypothetical protein